MERIYYDHAATTPLHPLAAEAMLAVMQGPPGNASSVHSFGRDARRIISAAREAIAGTLGCKPAEIVFTSGGTEADNMALRGMMELQAAAGKRHLITSAVEHHAVLRECQRLERTGCEVTYLPVDEDGRVSPEELAAAIRPETALVSIIYANNETGTLQPIAELAEIAGRAGVPFHTDAVQAYGKIPIDLSRLPVQLLSITAHKINGPHGIGALFLRQGTAPHPLLLGGSQEKKRRGGTENLAGIAGFARAAELAAAKLAEEAVRLDELSSQWITLLSAAADGVVINGSRQSRVPGIVNLSFPGLDNEALLMNLDLAGIAASAGSACTSGALEPSHVLQAMGLSEERMRSAIRFSFGLGNTTEEMQRAASKVETFLLRNRNSS